MKVLNSLHILKDCLSRWENLPTESEFIRHYARPMIPYAGDMFMNWGVPFDTEVEWARYREEALFLDPEFEEKRLRHWIAEMGKLLGFELEGEVLLCGAFEAMDGFARFERGRHKVFLGVDESHRLGAYLDVLETHELTHVARETRPSTWTGWGLDPKMERHVYLESMPDIEHLFSEGIACAISEVLVPGQDPWKYCYQNEETFRYVIENGHAVDREIRKELSSPNGDWSRWYNGARYRPEMPDYAHYVWAWVWVRTLLRDFAGGDPKKLIGLCSKDLIESALSFELNRSFTF
jgi:hypothetical protein